MEKDDKCAGRAPVTKVGGVRIPQKPTRSKNDSGDAPVEEATPIANIGGLGGAPPVVVTVQDLVDNEEQLAAKNQQPSNPEHNVNTKKGFQNPKVQQSHKPVQQNINQPR